MHEIVHHTYSPPIFFVIHRYWEVSTVSNQFMWDNLISFRECLECGDSGAQNLREWVEYDVPGGLQRLSVLWWLLHSSDLLHPGFLQDGRALSWTCRWVCSIYLQEDFINLLLKRITSFVVKIWKMINILPKTSVRNSIRFLKIVSCPYLKGEPL